MGLTQSQKSIIEKAKAAGQSPTPYDRPIHNCVQRNNASVPAYPRIPAAQDYCGCTLSFAAASHPPESIAGERLPARPDTGCYVYMPSCNTQIDAATSPFSCLWPTL